MHLLRHRPAVSLRQAHPARGRKPDPGDDLPALGYRDGRRLRHPLPQGVPVPGRQGPERSDPHPGRPFHLRHVDAVLRADGATPRKSHPQALRPHSRRADGLHPRPPRPLRGLRVSAGTEPQGGPRRAAGLPHDGLGRAPRIRPAPDPRSRVPGAALPRRIPDPLGGPGFRVERPQPPASSLRPEDRPAALRKPDQARRAVPVPGGIRPAAGGALPGRSPRPDGFDQTPAPHAAARTRPGKQTQAAALHHTQEPDGGNRDRRRGAAELHAPGGHPEAPRTAHPHFRRKRGTQGAAERGGEASGAGVRLPGGPGLSRGTGDRAELRAHSARAGLGRKRA